ncbi:hypothetical protein ACIQC0_11690 [Pseudarthrobacter sp. NPDC092419]|uniref:hypothetical protein n=1 Tax=Pseudarthrobacter sp. NPDC092419 TaxID=3364414 RepID=UPI0037F6BEF5
MQFDLSALETATLVFIGTLVFAAVLAVFVLTAALAAMLLLGLGRLAWAVAAGMLLAVVHGINAGWEIVARAAVGFSSRTTASGAREPVPAPSTGTYPRVI